MRSQSTDGIEIAFIPARTIDNKYSTQYDDILESSPKISGIHNDHFWKITATGQIRQHLSPNVTDLLNIHGTDQHLIEDDISYNDNITDYPVDCWVKVKYNDGIYYGIVTQHSASHIQVKCMEHGINAQYRWPKRDDMSWYYRQDIIQKINPPKQVGNRGWYELQ